MPDIKPLGDRVLLQRLEIEEEQRGGIIIPDTAKEKPQEARVVAVGPGRLDEDGDRIPIELDPGDRVLISKYGGTEVKLNGAEHLIVREDDILAVLED